MTAVYAVTVSAATETTAMSAGSAKTGWIISVSAAEDVRSVLRFAWNAAKYASTAQRNSVRNAAPAGTVRIRTDSV